MKRRPRVWADIDLSAISSNLALLRESIGGRGLMLVVKADAYGHGSVPIARHVLARGQAEAFGVGDSQEALELREAGVNAPILILGAVVDGEMEDVVQNDVSICVHSVSRVRDLERESRRQGRRCRVHVMVDTGMGRLGPFEDKAREIAELVARSDALELEGVATHFSCASNPNDPFTSEQRRRFDAFRRSLVECGLDVPVFHAANSGAVIDAPDDTFDMVRIGAAAYGLLARPGDDTREVRPALSLHTQVIYLKDVPAGTPISYNRLYVTEKKTRIATIPIGYNDGLRYGLSNRGSVLVRGCRAPIVGAVSMDYCMIDVGRIPGVRVGEPVTVIGRDGDDCITVPEIAKQLDTVPYEVTCGLGKRVERRYGPRHDLPSLTRSIHPVGEALDRR